MKRFRTTGPALLSGLLLIAAWPVSPLTPLIFVAWVPLLWLCQHTISRNRFFGSVFLTTLIWNTGTTWWIWNSTDVGTIAAIITNSLLMCLPWLGYFIAQKKYGRRTGYLALFCCWLLFEYIHLNWQLSWPWLTLGNALAMHPGWIQWYEYTGVAGGTIWILVVNILFLELTRNFQRLQHRIQWTLSVFLLLILPIGISQIILASRQATPTAAGHSVVIVQPNIDPYGKFDETNTAAQITELIRLSEQSIDSTTELVIWPETAMSMGDWQEHITANTYYQPVFAFVARHPKLALLSGIETYKSYGTDKASTTARKGGDGSYYDVFNAAVLIKDRHPLQFYNKSKLVPGVESLPPFLNFMAPVFEKFGGSTGGYGRSDSSIAFHLPGNTYTAAPIICYESIYGEYVSSYVQKGANLLTIITNDGWWGNTPGHRQHLQYARLRAIETRRWVARSANTGISAVIDPVGNILETRPWNQAAAFRYPIAAATGETFYVRYGDYIFRIASAIAVLLIALHVVSWCKRKFFS